MGDPDKLFIAVFYGTEDGEYIFYRDIALDVVYSVEDESAIFIQDIDALSDFAVDFIRGPERKSFLSIDATAPEDDGGAKLVFESFRIHTLCGALDGI